MQINLKFWKPEKRLSRNSEIKHCNKAPKIAIHMATEGRAYQLYKLGISDFLECQRSAFYTM